MKLNVDLFKGAQAPSQDFRPWIPGWWYRSEGMQIQRGKLPNGGEWLLVGFLLSEEKIDEIVERVAQDGVETLFKADGQFILAIYLKNASAVEIYRDRTGMLPIMYARGVKGLAVSIWMDHVIDLSGIRPSVSEALLRQFPLYRITILPDTPIKEVNGLSGRCSLRIDKDAISVIDHPMSFSPKELYGDLKSAGNELGEILSEAVRKRVKSCKSVGAWLSGGNDSSLLVALARKHFHGKIKTVFVTFEDYQRNYGKHASDVARKYDTEHFEVKLSAREYANLWSETIFTIQDPVNSPAAIGQLAALKKLGLSVDVMLIGEGADTIFGGPYWAPMLMLSNMGRVLPDHLRKVLRETSRQISDKTFLSKAIAKGVRALGTPLREYIHSENAFGDEENVDRIFGLGTWQETIGNLQNYIKEPIFNDLFLYLLLDWLPNYNAALKRIGFQYGLMYVLPFLDYELMQNSLRLPHHLRYHYSTKKAPLKHYALNYFDKDFINKPKEGFGVPLGKWFSTQEFAPFLGLPLEERSLRRGWWKENDLRQIIEMHKAGGGTDRSAESIPWMTINLELWARICLEGDSPDLYKV